jgi:hypothetical protein
MKPRIWCKYGVWLCTRLIDSQSAKRELGVGWTIAEAYKSWLLRSSEVWGGWRLIPLGRDKVWWVRDSRP